MTKEEMKLRIIDYIVYNENIINHFWSNIGHEINDVKNELMDLEIKLITYLAKEV